MPLTALRRCEPLLERIVVSLKPARIITEVGKGDRAAYFRNFKGYRVEKFSRHKILGIARKELYTRENEFWAQLLIVLWNESHRDVYNAFRDRVATINEDVEEVLRIPDETADEWLDELLDEHAVEDLLICIYMNEVRFSDAFLRRRLEAPMKIERPADDLFGPDGESEEEGEAEAQSDPEASSEASPEDTASPV